MTRNEKLLERVQDAKARLKAKGISKIKFYSSFGSMSYKEFMDLDNRWSYKVADQKFTEKLEKYVNEN